MLGMIRFGADEIFRPQGQLSDEDIDVLIARGEERTEKDNACLKQSANTLASASHQQSLSLLFDVILADEQLAPCTNTRSRL